MLHDFLTQERETILSLAQEKAQMMEGWRVAVDGMQDGWYALYDEIIDLMKQDQPFEFHNERGQHTIEAEKHGREYQRLGYSLSDVVHSYGVICQAITEHASDRFFDITPREFQQLNLSLDTAIAEAVTEFDKIQKEAFDSQDVEKLGALAYDLRICIQNIVITLEMIQSGSVGARSSTGAVLERNLQRMTKLIDVALTNVRLSSAPKLTFLRTRVLDMMHEVGITAGLDARSKKVTLVMQGAPELEVEVDRQLFISALANLVQNALKFSKQGGTVSVRSHLIGDQIRVEVEDACGGVTVEEIHSFLNGDTQDQPAAGGSSGLGTAIATTKRAIEQNRGRLLVENVPDNGCIFIMELPNAEAL